MPCISMSHRLRGRVLGDPLMDSGEPSAAAAPATSARTSPHFSEALPRYIEAVKDKGWRRQSHAQNGATFARFKEVCGDQPLSAFTRRDLGNFYEPLRGHPALYSKDRKWRGLPLAEIVTSRTTRVACSVVFSSRTPMNE